jgi:ribosomal protein L31E
MLRLDSKGAAWHGRGSRAMDLIKIHFTRQMQNIEKVFDISDHH